MDTFKTLWDAILSDTCSPRIRSLIDSSISKQAQNHSMALIDAFNGAKTTTIKLANKPLYKNPFIETLPIHDFCNDPIRFKNSPFLWTDSLLVPEKGKQRWNIIYSNWSDLDSEDKKLKAYFNQRPWDLVICEIDNRVGQGVFTAEPIPNGEIVCIYSGMLTTDQNDEVIYKTHYTFWLPSFYSLLFDEQELDEFMLLQEKKEFKSQHNYQINAEICGNIARFIQHMPTQDDLNADKKLKDATLIATQNVEYVQTVYQGWPVIYLKTVRDIKAGEQLGYSYGEDYWNYHIQDMNIHPVYFNQNGDVI